MDDTGADVVVEINVEVGVDIDVGTEIIGIDVAVDVSYTIITPNKLLQQQHSKDIISMMILINYM